MQGGNANMGKWAFAAIGGTVALAALAPVRTAQSLAASPEDKMKLEEEKNHQRARLIEVAPEYMDVLFAVNLCLLHSYTQVNKRRFVRNFFWLQAHRRGLRNYFD
jgi:hypothetical protein